MPDRPSCCAPSRSRDVGAGATTCPPPENPRTGPGASAPDEGVLVRAGTFRMGTDDPDRNPADGESPVRPVPVAAFRIGATCVTNAEFAAFVEDTGYVTVAQEYGWSFVFGGLLSAEVRRASRRPPGTPWWRAVEGAIWSAPEGPGSSVAERADHPGAPL